MTPAQVEEAATLLLAARGDFRRLERFPESCAPSSLDDGYAIQEAVAKAIGLPVTGFKIGCTSKEAQAMLGSPGPFPGRVFAPFRLDSPARIAATAFHKVGIEAEFAFTLAHSLPARAAPYRREEVAAAIATLHPAIEIVDSRWTDWLAVGVPHIVADNGANGALVLGPGTADWRQFDLAAHPVTLLFNGAVKAEGTGAAALGHPLEALTWLANDLSRRGYGLAAGQAVTTGTCTGLNFAAVGDRIEVDIGKLGRAELEVTA